MDQSKQIQLAIEVKVEIELGREQPIAINSVYQRKPLNRFMDFNVVNFFTLNAKGEVEEEDIRDFVCDQTDIYLTKENVFSYLHGLNYQINIQQIRTFPIQ